MDQAYSGRELADVVFHIALLVGPVSAVQVIRARTLEERLEHRLNRDRVRDRYVIESRYDAAYTCFGSDRTPVTDIREQSEYFGEF